MCANAEAQVINIAQVAETTTISLLTESKLISTTQGTTITSYFSTLITDLKAWKSGTPATNILQVVQDIQALLPSLPIPAPFNLLVPVALGGLETILTLLGANSPAPVEAGVEATTEALAANQELHAHATAAAGEAKVVQLTGYKASKWDKARAMVGDTHVASDAYRKVWNETVESNSLPETLKAA